jgi:hypothetical protein
LVDRVMVDVVVAGWMMTVVDAVVVAAVVETISVATSRMTEVVVEVVAVVVVMSGVKIHAHADKYCSISAQKLLVGEPADPSTPDRL